MSVFNIERSSLRSADAFNKLCLAYLERDEQLKDYFDYYPDLAGFGQVLDRNPYGDFNREFLTSILKEQASYVANSTRNTLKNINLLSNKNSFCITTGHQLCLFTGPMYFIYKIFSAINLAEALKKAFPDKDFVPVYWMAGEDHDFEEVNHFHVFGKTLKWSSNQKGPVGDFNTVELKDVFNNLSQILGDSENGLKLTELFNKAYLEHNNLGSATRYLVNELFGEYGLVIVDGSHKSLKTQLRKIIHADVFDHLPVQAVKETNASLNEKGFHTQVNPRSINFFYAEPGKRLRIEREDQHFKLHGTEQTISNEEMIKLIEETPELLSPNVVTRALYQQTILPSIAYVGGPAELAYWLQFRGMFSKMKTFFPMLVPRSFNLIVDNASCDAIVKLGFKVSDFFSPEDQLIKTFLENSGDVFVTEVEEEKLNDIYSNVIQRIETIDKTLSGTVASELQKALKGLDFIKSKANKVVKQKQEIQINRVKTIKQKLFPDGIPQERHENFSTYYFKYGPDFLKFLKEQINPLIFNYNTIIEDSASASINAY